MIEMWEELPFEIKLLMIAICILIGLVTWTVHDMWSYDWSKHF